MIFVKYNSYENTKGAMQNREYEILCYLCICEYRVDC